MIYATPGDNARRSWGAGFGTASVPGHGFQTRAAIPTSCACKTQGSVTNARKARKAQDAFEANRSARQEAP